MANEFGVNISINTDQWVGIWHLIRRMMKAGYWLRASSDGVTKVVSNVPTAHVGNVGTGFAPLSTANAGSSASITAIAVHPYGNLLTLTGLSGMLAPTVSGGRSEGNYLTLTGCATASNNGTWQIYEVLSSSSVVVLVRGGTPAAPDANNGSITWQEKDVMSASGTSYGMEARQWWVCLEGMETYQVNFTVAVTGEFLRGEKVTQAGSSATGECVGVVFDAANAAGYMVIQPHTGVFTGSGLITGASSGATVTATAFYKFRRQWVFHKSSTGDSTTGSAWYAILRDDGSTEIAEIYSVKASNAACTAIVAPGGSPTSGNRQISSGATWGNSRYVLRCRNNATDDGVTAVVHTDGIIHPAASGPNGRANISVANIMPRLNRAADGTWWILHGNANVAGGGGNLMACFRIDAGEEGEVETLIHFTHGNSGGNSNTQYETAQATTASNFASRDFISLNTNNTEWRKIVRRAYGLANTAFVMLEHTTLSVSSVDLSSSGLIMGKNWGYTQRMYSHTATVPPGFKEPLGIGAGFRGRLRWGFAVQQGAVYDTFEGRKFLCINGYAAPAPGFMIGPWNQTDDPIQT